MPTVAACNGRVFTPAMPRDARRDAGVTGVWIRC
jgi:hypothetical protein